MELMQKVVKATHQHLDALVAYDRAVQKGARNDEIVTLKHAQDDRAVDRQEAMDRYRLHLLTHQSKALAAGVD